MLDKIYHGQINPEDFARDLIAHFNQGNFRVQQIGEGNQISVQIGTSEFASSGGKTALTVSLQAVADGVSVRIGQQAWMGIAASLGFTVLTAIRNPFELLGRIDDIAQDIENLQLSEEVWRIIDETAKSIGANQELSERLRRLECTYCQTANPVGESNCIACGAPLGDIQPTTCPNCGFIVLQNEKKCAHCGQYL